LFDSPKFVGTALIIVELAVEETGKISNRVGFCLLDVQHPAVDVL
jgi:hypothetical protein